MANSGLISTAEKHSLAFAQLVQDDWCHISFDGPNGEKVNMILSPANMDRLIENLKQVKQARGY